jgi:hypothetical protein
MRISTTSKLRNYFLDQRTQTAVKTFLHDDTYLFADVFDDMLQYATAFVEASAVQAELVHILCRTFDATLGRAIRDYNNGRSDFLRYVAAEDRSTPGDGVLPPKPSNVWAFHAVECQVAPAYTYAVRGFLGVHVQWDGSLQLSLRFKRDGTRPASLEIDGWAEHGQHLIFSRPEINLVADKSVDISPLQEAAGVAVFALAKKLYSEQDTDYERWVRKHRIERTY